MINLHVCFIAQFVQLLCHWQSWRMARSSHGLKTNYVFHVFTHRHLGTINKRSIHFYNILFPSIILYNIKKLNHQYLNLITFFTIGYIDFPHACSINVSRNTALAKTTNFGGKSRASIILVWTVLSLIANEKFNSNWLKICLLFDSKVCRYH